MTISASPSLRPQSKGAERLDAAFAAFDRANAADPHRETVEGHSVPKELAYAQRMSTWLDRLYPEASEALRLAARCQHIERWIYPRASYPEGRIGYLTWRRDLKRYHARRAGEIMADLGYPDTEIARVESLLRKEGLKRDADAQALEDVVCVVFLAHYFAEFAEGHARDKVIDILRKTWAKMSPHGRRAAMRLPLRDDARELVEMALQGEISGD